MFVSAGIKFSYFFAVSLGFAAINVSILLLTFKLKRDEIIEEESQELVEQHVDAAQVEGGNAALPETSAAKSKTGTVVSMKEVLQSKIVVTISFFLMLYCVSFRDMRYSTFLPKKING